MRAAAANLLLRSLLVAHLPKPVGVKLGLNSSSRPRKSLAIELTDSAVSVDSEAKISSNHVEKSSEKNSLEKLNVQVTELDDDAIRDSAAAHSKLPNRSSTRFKSQLNSSSFPLDGVFGRAWRWIIGSSLADSRTQTVEWMRLVRENYWRNVIASPDSVLAAPTALRGLPNAREASERSPHVSVGFGALSVIFLLSVVAFVGLPESIRSFWGVSLLLLGILRIFLALLLSWTIKQEPKCQRSLEELLSSSSAFNKSFRKAIQYIQEIELVSLGYKVSSPLSPVARLERTSKDRKSTLVRQSVLNALRVAIAAFGGPASPSLYKDPLGISSLKSLYADFSDCRYTFISSRVDDLTSPLGFVPVALQMDSIEQKLRSASDSIQRALSQQEWVVPEPQGKARERKEYQTTTAFIRHLSSLQYQLSTISARISLMKQILSAPMATDEDKMKNQSTLLETFAKLTSELAECGALRGPCDRALSKLVLEWSGALQTPAEVCGSSSLPMAPEPVEAEIEDSPSGLSPDELKTLVERAVESVYEALNNETVNNPGSAVSSGPKLTREQRIAEKKKKVAENVRSHWSIYCFHFSAQSFAGEDRSIVFFYPALERFVV